MFCFTSVPAKSGEKDTYDSPKGLLPLTGARPPSRSTPGHTPPRTRLLSEARGQRRGHLRSGGVPPGDAFRGTGRATVGVTFLPTCPTLSLSGHTGVGTGSANTVRATVPRQGHREYRHLPAPPPPGVPVLDRHRPPPELRPSHQSRRRTRGCVSATHLDGVHREDRPHTRSGTQRSGTTPRSVRPGSSDMRSGNDRQRGLPGRPPTRVLDPESPPRVLSPRTLPGVTTPHSMTDLDPPRGFRRAAGQGHDLLSTRRHPPPPDAECLGRGSRVLL